MSTKFVQARRALLQSAISDSATSMTVTEFVDLNGDPIVSADIGTVGYGTLAPNTAKEEAISFTIDSNTAGTAVLTITRGLLGKQPYGTGGPSYAHNAGTEFILSNNPDLFNKLTAKDNDETVTGAWKFPATPTHDQHPVPKKYLEDNAVMKTGAQTVAGVKTFSDSPVIPAAGGDTSPYQKQEVDALDTANVKLTGDQTVAGVKTFSSSPVVPDATAANQPLTKGQFDAGATAYLTDASPSAQGAVKIDTAADDPGDPVALTGTADRVNFMTAIPGMIFAYAAASAPTGFLLCDGSAVSRTTYANLFSVCGTSYGIGDGTTTFNVPDLRSRFPLGYSGGVAPTKTFTFVDGDVNTSTDIITVDENKYLYTGQAVSLTTSGTLPTGLSATTYYVIYVSDTTIKLATSRANADDGTAVDITAAAGGGTHTLTLTLTQRDMGDNGGEESHALQTEELASHNHSTGVGTASGLNSAEAGENSTYSASYPTDSTGGDTPHNNMPPYVTVNYIIKT